VTTHGYLSLTPPLALAVMEGRKTQTMRPMTPQVPDVSRWQHWTDRDWYTWSPLGMGVVRAPCAPDDVLWVREPAMVMGYTPRGTRVTVQYDADGVTREVPWPERLRPVELGHRIPNGCHREAARTYVRVLSVEPRRVQSITEAEARAEGMPWGGPSFDVGLPDEDLEAGGVTGSWAIPNFRHTWDSLYRAKGLGWDANPWVWMVRFERVEADRE